jgi:hypothetical protein
MALQPSPAHRLVTRSQCSLYPITSKPPASSRGTHGPSRISHPPCPISVLTDEYAQGERPTRTAYTVVDGALQEPQNPIHSFQYYSTTIAPPTTALQLSADRVQKSAEIRLQTPLSPKAERNWLPDARNAMEGLHFQSHGISWVFNYSHFYHSRRHITKDTTVVCFPSICSDMSYHCFVPALI